MLLFQCLLVTTLVSFVGSLVGASADRLLVWPADAAGGAGQWATWTVPYVGATLAAASVAPSLFTRRCEMYVGWWWWWWWVCVWVGGGSGAGVGPSFLSLQMAGGRAPDAGQAAASAGQFQTASAQSQAGLQVVGLAPASCCEL